MEQAMSILTVARAEALCLSCVSADHVPSRTEADDAIRATVRQRGGHEGLAAGVAQLYGDCPELAAPRMRWALGVVGKLYPPRTASTCTPTIPRPRRELAARRP